RHRAHLALHSFPTRRSSDLQATSADDLANIVVTNVGNVPVRVGDVANVTPGLEPRFTIVTANGRPAVLINVLRQPKANILTVVEDRKSTRLNSSHLGISYAV